MEDLNNLMRENSEVGAFLHYTQGDIHAGISESVEMKGTRYVSVVNGIALVNLIGPIYPRANMMTSSGATSIQQYFADFAKAYDDNEIKGIVQVMDTPGGDVRGIGENSHNIHKLVKSGKKPVQTYVSGYMASAGYYVGSTSESIISNDSGIAGSIGVILTAQKKTEGTVEIISSVSPNKRPDVSSDEGRAVLQEQVDDLAKVFVKDIAKFRGVDKDKILQDYGQGAVKVGARAKSVGLVDDISNLSQVVEKMARGRSTSRYAVGKAAGWASDTIQSLFYAKDEADFETEDEPIVGADLLAIEGAVNMSWKDMVAKLVGKKTEAGDNAAETVAGIEGQTNPAVPLLNREEIMDSFADAGELFATRLTTGHKIMPYQQSQAAMDIIIARTDDKFYGGKVPFINASGELVEGTREQAVTARYENMPKHTLTEQAVAAVEKGDVAASVLPEGKDEKVTTDVVTKERRTELLSKTEEGRKVLAEEKAKV